jgi:tryptophan 2,3-dioxygenase
MTEEYGKRVPLSYNSYLRVPDLIELQGCCSDPAHHDELLFITIHQTYELWFKQILHELDAAIELIEADKLLSATRAVNRAVEIEKILVNQIHILETMTPIGFLGFREELNPASGFQSMQFREIEFVSGLKDEKILQAFNADDYATARLQRRFDAPSLHDAFFQLLSRRGMDAPSDDCALAREERTARHDKRVQAIVQLLTHFERAADLFSISESLIAHDEYVLLWRAHHVAMVERMLGAKPGTGGSEGAGYLRSTLSKKFFPEFWEARTQLTPDTDKSLGCPFA